MRDRVLARQLGSLIRGLRVKQGMSQEEFADHCSLHRTYIGSIERGEKTITIETAYKIHKLWVCHYHNYFDGWRWNRVVMAITEAEYFSSGKRGYLCLLSYNLLITSSYHASPNFFLPYSNKFGSPVAEILP